ncbi:unnamed protein product [Rangifer tarandus platyrhynchus]|uniref:Uncharacterized protein n=2 Tax=Rangifer tarandus platyrhynchus TaxID=3082113 RepID=A0ABN8ZLB0_RANTA|nr:unnamed protein product [Rangifer tarandus platyrhynchus]
MTERQYRTFPSNSVCFFSLNCVLPRVSPPGGLPKTSAKSGFIRSDNPHRGPFCLVWLAFLFHGLGTDLELRQPLHCREDVMGRQRWVWGPTVIFTSFVKHTLFPFHLDAGCHFLHRHLLLLTH